MVLAGRGLGASAGVLLELCELLRELLKLLALVGRRSWLGVRMRVGLTRWDRLWVALVWIGLTTPAVWLALVYCHWVNSPSIADTGRLGWRGQLHRTGLIRRHRDIRACCGPISE